MMRSECALWDPHKPVALVDYYATLSDLSWLLLLNNFGRLKNILRQDPWIFIIKFCFYAGIIGILSSYFVLIYVI